MVFTTSVPQTSFPWCRPMPSEAAVQRLFICSSLVQQLSTAVWPLGRACCSPRCSSPSAPAWAGWSWTRASRSWRRKSPRNRRRCPSCSRTDRGSSSPRDTCSPTAPRRGRPPQSRWCSSSRRSFVSWGHLRRGIYAWSSLVQSTPSPAFGCCRARPPIRCRRGTRAPKWSPKSSATPPHRLRGGTAPRPRSRPCCWRAAWHRGSWRADAC
mmetsp:Transcript_36110/g.81169  ORF Transcript_36110/g.81169 Transcript_36110/m.81169 type:complete len:211 (+) Transcript_36110:136-768(+)